MIVNMIGNGVSAGSSGVNFKLVCASSQPASPSENTIWVKTSTSPTIWSMIDNVSKSTNTADSTIIITYLASNNLSKTFNALKKNELLIKLTKCYQRISSKWVSMDAYIYTNNKWIQFSNVFKATITVGYPSGSACYVTSGSTRINAPDASGLATFTIPFSGTWTITCTDGTQTASSTVSITTDGQTESISLSYNKIPKFSYTGDYQIVNDNGDSISITTDNNWNIKFLTNGTLNIQELNGLTDGAQLFLVGGGGGGSNKAAGSSSTSTIWGGGGGGSGYVSTVSLEQNLPTSVDIDIVIGAGGSINADGNTTSFTVLDTVYHADGGKAGNTKNGGAGGSGGGAGSWGYVVGKHGGYGGYNGEQYINATWNMNADGGIGQANIAYPNPSESAPLNPPCITNAFGESTGYSYAQGGAGGGGANDSSTWNGAAQGDSGNRGNNTGDGGKGFSNAFTGMGGKAIAATAGCSGIIIMRSKRS